MSKRLQLHIAVWLTVVIALLFGSVNAVAECAPGAMPVSAPHACCVQARTPCRCTPDDASAPVSTNSWWHGEGALHASCPCVAPASPQDRAPACESVRVVVQAALLPAIQQLPVSFSMQAPEACAEACCTLRCDSCAFPSPPRAPPFRA